MSASLTDKQKAFCDYYLIDYNATQAAIKAGYSKKTAKVQGHQLLNKTLLQEYLKTKQQRLETKLEATKERTILEMCRLAYQDARIFFNEDGSLIPIHLLSDDAAAAISAMDVEELFEYSREGKTQVGIVKKIKRYDKLKALEMIARHLGIFEKDNEQLQNVVAVTLNLSK